MSEINEKLISKADTPIYGTLVIMWQYFQYTYIFCYKFWKKCLYLLFYLYYFIHVLTLLAILVILLEYVIGEQGGSEPITYSSR